MTQQGQEDVVAQLRDLSRHPRYHGVTWTSSEAAICGAAADEIDCLRTLLSSSRGECGSDRGSFESPALGSGTPSVKADRCPSPTEGDAE